MFALPAPGSRDLGAPGGGVGLLPVPAVEMPDLDPLEVDALHAAQVHVDLVRVRARLVEGGDAAAPAEVVLRRAGPEPVGGEALGGGQQAEALARHVPVQVGLAPADRAVADLDPLD